MSYKPNPKLWKAIKEKNLTQRKLSEQVGIHYSIICNVINGRSNLKESEKKQVAKALKKPVNELFED